MAAAPNLPISETATWTINIDDTFTPNHQGLVIGEGDQVNFQNNSGVNIIIEFQENPPGSAVYANMNLAVNNGLSAAFTAPNYDCAANYYIYNSSVTPPAEVSGPYVIQVGDGPMFVHINQAPGQSVTYTPQEVAVPLGATNTGMGELEMISDLPSTSFDITWGNGDPFDPPLQGTGSSHPVDAGANAQNYPYDATQATPVATGGGGTIIIRSS